MGAVPAPRRKSLAGKRVLVTDAESRLGLYVIRSLGRAGCRITALSGKTHGPVLGFGSRFTARRYRLPAGDYPETLSGVIEELAPSHDLLMPVTAFSISVVASGAERLAPRIPFFVPPLEAFQIASDKRQTAAVAQRAGVPVPESYSLSEMDSITDWAAQMAHRLPLVIKFSDEDRSGSWAPADRYRIVRSRSELVEEYTRMHAIGPYPLVQEYVEGEGYGFFAVFDRCGAPTAVFCHRRLREYPISGGPSTLCESYYDSALVDVGTRLLKALDWRGVAMVECKRDRRTGEYKVLEINPRFWGSLPLALRCGVDFPVYQAQIALGFDPTPPSSYPLGRKVRFFFPDFLAVRDEWRAGGRWRVGKRYLRELLNPSIRDGFFDLLDPWPTVAYLAEKLRR